jgi:hypothetical protein
MRTLLLTTAALAMLTVPAMARCHGHELPDGHWTLNIDSWSQSELIEINGVLKQIKQIDPKTTSGPADLASIVDQEECRGISHESIIRSLIGMTRAIEDLN